MIENFLHLPPVSLTPVANLELRISPRMIGTNTNKSIGQNFKNTSDGTAQTDPFQKNLLENPKEFFKSLKVPSGVKKPIQAKNTEGST